MEFEEEEVELLADRIERINYPFRFFSFKHKSRPRPEFVIRSSAAEKNPVTGILEPYFPARSRRYRIIIGIVTLSFMVNKT